MKQENYLAPGDNHPHIIITYGVSSIVFQACPIKRLTGPSIPPQVNATETTDIAQENGVCNSFPVVVIVVIPDQTLTVLSALPTLYQRVRSCE
jgi:hypothetical protein